MIDNVLEWYQKQNFGQIFSDTERVNIQPDTPLGSFEVLILAVLYSSEINPHYAEQTITSLRENNLTDINMWATINENDPPWNMIVEIFQTDYQGRMINRKIDFLRNNANFVINHLNGDVRQVYEICNGNEVMMLNYLRDNIKGIKVKAFWFLREMRMRGIWNVQGHYCCVPDKQVGKSLERWHYINQYNNSFNTHLQCSQIVWDFFGELYDFPGSKLFKGSQL